MYAWVFLTYYSKMVQKLTYSHDNIAIRVSDLCICDANMDSYILTWVRDQTAFSSCLVSFAEPSVCSCCHDLHYSNDLLSFGSVDLQNKKNYKALSPY